MLQIPSTCPICASTLERVNDQLFCRNESCDAKTSKKLQHFVKTMKIKGLGEKTIEKLDLTDIYDLYELSIEKLTSTVGEKIGTKLLNEIAQSKEANLSTFIQSFGIPLIGNSAATKLAKVTDSLWKITEPMAKTAGLGEKATSNLLNWIKLNRSKYEDLPIKTITSKVNKVEEKFSVCITGKLNDFSSRPKAKEFLETKGVKVLSSLSSKTDYLVCDQSQSTSSSFVKAKNLNIPIITMNELLIIIEGDINV
jgi:DNA ligase (NAD+)